MTLRHALRLLLRSPSFTLLVVSILALGIGATTAIFTVFNALLLKPLPYRAPDRLYLVTAVTQGDQPNLGCLTWPRFNQIAERNQAFSGFAAFTFDTLNLTGQGEPEQLQAGRVSWNFFQVLGVQPALGRSFRPEEGTPAGSPAVLITGSLWIRRFGHDPGVIGRSINLGSTAYTIAGVLPAGFAFGLLPAKVEVWVPRIDELSLMTPEHLRSGVCYLNAVARLRPGVSVSASRSQMAVLADQYAREFAKLPDSHHVVEVEPLQDQLVGSFRPILLVLASAVALVLLIGCANVSSLLLARSVSRRKEFAIRRALGATTAGLIRMSLTESLFTALLGGTLGIAVSIGGVRLLAARFANFMPRSEELATASDSTVLFFAVAVSVLTGVLFGLAPALLTSQVATGNVLREEGRGTSGSRRRNRIRSGMVIAQLALSVVLLVAAGLLVRTFIYLLTLPAGFEPGHTLTMTLAVSPASYSRGEQLLSFYDQVLHRIERLPGVSAAAGSSALPVNPARASPVLIEGQPALPLAERPVVYVQTFLHDYLRALGVPLIRGRAFTQHDQPDSPPVVMVNQAFARKFFPGQDAVGHHLSLGRATKPAEIVGILGDVKNVTLAAPASPEVELPFAQLPWPSMNITVRTAGRAAQLPNAIRREIAAVDPSQPVTNLQTLDDVLSAARAQPRVLMILVGVFAASAFSLALVGLYAVISYSVNQRYQEMGVRMALGASGPSLIRLIVGQGLALSAAGVAIGLAVSFVATRMVAALLYGVTSHDPLTFFWTPVVLLLFAALASGIPALRAARLDPNEALRTSP